MAFVVLRTRRLSSCHGPSDRMWEDRKRATRATARKRRSRSDAAHERSEFTAFAFALSPRPPLTRNLARSQDYL